MRDSGGEGASGAACSQPLGVVTVGMELSQDARTALALCWKWYELEQAEVDRGSSLLLQRIGARNVMLGTGRRLARAYGVDTRAADARRVWLGRFSAPARE